MADDWSGSEKQLGKLMSNLQQAAVKLILDALRSTNLTMESFIAMAISTAMEPSLKVPLGWRHRDLARRPARESFK